MNRAPTKEKQAARLWALGARSARCLSRRFGTQ